jgi:nucleotide-binding universal stress UspA family protein
MQEEHDAGHDPCAAVIGDMVAAWSRKFPAVPVSTGLPATHPAEALVTASRTAQLLVIGWRGRGAFVGMTLGSVAHAVVQHSQCPVLVWRDHSTGRPQSW